MKFFVHFLAEPDRSRYGSNYGSFEIRVGDTDKWRKTHARFTWQYGSDRSDEDQTSLYAFTYHMEGNDEDEFALQKRIIQYVMKHTDANFYTKPGPIIKALEKYGCVEAVYDSRQSEYVKLGEVLPDNVYAYIDNYELLGNTSGCTYGALASTEQEAQTRIITKAAEAGNVTFLEKFVKAGMPVFIPYRSEKPDDRTWIEKLTDAGLQSNLEPEDANEDV